MGWVPVRSVVEGATGTIPTMVGLLTALTKLELRRTKLEGSLPADMRFLRNLTHLTVAENPDLDGRLPSLLGYLTHLEALELFDNKLYGTVPSQLGLLTRCERR